MNHSTRNHIFLLVVAAVMMMVVVKPVLTLAMPREPIDPPRVGEPEGYIAPDNGFEWGVPPRFGLSSNFIVNFNWDEENAKYYSTYVHPENFPATFDGCRTDADEESGTSSMTYTWQIDGDTIEGDACRIQYIFDHQGTYSVSLRITKTDGSVLLDEQGRGDPFQQEILMKDILIVSLGDSRASGEGSPDRAQVLGNLDIFGQPTEVVQQVKWQDSRCHRSARSGHAQAAMAIEWADPHTSVTFLSFACSGTTINTPQYADASTFDPYRNPDSYGWTKALGTGILGTFAGTEPPDPAHPQDNQLPSQIDQLMAALTNDGEVPARPVDALLITAGGNDIHFGDIAALCTIYKDCQSLPVTASSFDHFVPLQQRLQEDIDAIADRFATMASVISDTVPFSPNGEVYITQYDDPTRNTDGSLCTKMLDDVMPDWMGPIITFAAFFDWAPPGTIKVPFNVSGTEVEWAAGIAPALNQAIAEAAEDHGWTLVDGIQDDTANLFSGHGYCAANNWVRRAEESVIRQGPWVYGISIPPVTNRTKGTLHPTDAGYWMIAQRIIAKLAPNLLPSPPANPPAPPTFTSSSKQSLLGENGWLTGHTVGVACPVGAANCAFAQVEAHAASDTEMRGVSLLINGASPTCSETGVTTNGITCQARLTNAQTYNWSFAFANDGIYQLDFRVTTRNNAEGQFSQAVKVDLHDPVGTQTLSAPTPGSGWYTAPVSVTVTAADGSGSGVQSIEYELDGAAEAASGNSVSLVIDTDGSHSVGYQVVDFAGRISALDPLTIHLDQIAPTSTAQTSPAANAAGWNNENVLVTLSTTDTDGSGVESLTYSATGAQSIASTPVDGVSPVQFSITTEGVTTIRFVATDVAGNIEETQNIDVRLDKTAPVVNCAAADGQWHGSDVSLACTVSDSGSGFAGGPTKTFNLTTSVAAGTETANASTDSQQVCDLAGNCATAGPIAGNKVDKKAPSITVSSPTGANYELNQVVASDYTCTDGGSEISTCSGPVADGSNIDTSTPGAKAFEVGASDQVGNTSTQVVNYNVTYKLCLLYETGKSYKKGSTVPLRLQLCDVGTVNYSAGSIILTANDLVLVDGSTSSEIASSGNANPDNNFRYDIDLLGYIYNLSTKGLSTGTWALSFTVTGDPVTHTIFFDIR